jgi:hypothetical protein
MIIIDVYGKPEPGGSKRGFKRGARVVVVDANPNVVGWKSLVIDAAMTASDRSVDMAVVRSWTLQKTALTAVCTFYMQRPQGHYGSGKNAGKLKATAPMFPVTKPDATKLWRSTEDALTGIIWGDDAQITNQYIFKQYADNRPPGARIKVYATLEI